MLLDEISYDEMIEMASVGTGVMHSRSVAIGKRYNVKIRIRNMANDNPGTIITHEVPQMEGILVSGATIQKDMAKIGLAGIPNVPGTAAQIFARLAEAKVVIDDIIQTEISHEKANLSFMVRKSDLAAAKKVANELKAELGSATASSSATTSPWFPPSAWECDRSTASPSGCSAPWPRPR